MRVIGGTLRSRSLRAPAGMRVRPTSDALRETLFNVLGPAVGGSVFVDCYAGTGAVGIEAFSRGAEHVIFIESSRAALKTLRENLRSLDIHAASRTQARAERGVTVIERTVSDALDELSRLAPSGCDFVFLDPPYAHAHEYERALLELEKRNDLIREHSVIVAEHARRNPLKKAYGTLACYRTRNQGDSALSFFRRAVESRP